MASSTHGLLTTKKLSPASPPVILKIQSLIDDESKRSPEIEVKISNSIERAIKSFDWWMKNFIGHTGTDNEEFLGRLTQNSGVDYAQNYSLFCEIAEVLSSKGYKTSPPPLEADYSRSLGLHIEIPESNKPYLREIQKKFSCPLLTARSNGSLFSMEEGLFLYANDSTYIDDYLVKLFAGMERIAKPTQEFKLFNSLSGRKDLVNIGIVIGNSHILSLLPDFPIEVFLLLDIDPRVHLFILKIKELILKTDDNVSFETMRSNLIEAIKLLQNEIEFLSRSISEDSVSNLLKSERTKLGDKHFLSSPERFAQCKKALQIKELLPIKVDMFDIKLVEELGNLLKKSGCQITFMNLTNIADYDRNYSLLKNLEYLPFTPTTVFIATSLVGFPSKECDPACFVSIGRENLATPILYSYNWNTKPYSIYCSGFGGM